MGERWRLCYVLAALVALSGCRSCGCQGLDVRPVLGKFVVKRSAGATVRKTSIVLDETRIVSKARALLSAGDLFAAADGSDEKHSRADVAISLEVLADDAAIDAEVGIKVRLRVDVHPSAPATARYAEDATALGQAPLGDTADSELVAAFQRLAERTVEDLVRGYTTRQSLWSADEPAIARALASTEGDVRGEAARIVGARKLKAELPAVIRLLSDDDEATRDAALGAVVAMGERGAIKALANSRQMRDSYEMSKVVDAVAALGGQEAKDYLSFVAETHDDPEIRKMAEAALDRLKTQDTMGLPTK